MTSIGPTGGGPPHLVRQGLRIISRDGMTIAVLAHHFRALPASSRPAGRKPSFSQQQSSPSGGVWDVAAGSEREADTLGWASRSPQDSCCSLREAPLSLAATSRLCPRCRLLIPSASACERHAGLVNPACLQGGDAYHTYTPWDDAASETRHELRAAYFCSPRPETPSGRDRPYARGLPPGATDDGTAGPTGLRPPAQRRGDGSPPNRRASPPTKVNPPPGKPDP
jgi:hypothetical protein